MIVHCQGIYPQSKRVHNSLRCRGIEEPDWSVWALIIMLELGGTENGLEEEEVVHI